MQPFLFLQLPLPLQLVLLLPMIVVENLSPGTKVDVLLPQYVNQVQVLEKQPNIIELEAIVHSCRENTIRAERRIIVPAVWNMAFAPATPCPLRICSLTATLELMSRGRRAMNNKHASLFPLLPPHTSRILIWYVYPSHYSKVWILLSRSSSLTVR